MDRYGHLFPPDDHKATMNAMVSMSLENKFSEDMNI